MYTQKELIKNALESLHPVARKYFIYSWLEDINWHRENTLFCERNINTEENNVMESLEKLAMVIKPHAYSQGFIAEHAEELSVYKKEYDRANGKGLVHFPNGTYATQTMIADFLKATEFQRAFVYMTGWGLSDGWASTSGEEFVKDIESLFVGFNKIDEDARATHEAYARLND